MSTDKGSAPWDNWDTHYREFQEQEGIPVHTGMAINDIRTVEVDDWDRFGGQGAFINLFGMEGTCDVQILDIPPGVELNPQRHLHDALVYVVNGNGFTTVGEGNNEKLFEWGQHAAFYLPQNTQYVHTNGSDDDTARLMIGTPLPLLYSLFRDHGIIWENDFDHWKNVDVDAFYSTETEIQSETDDYNIRYTETNFIPNTLAFDQLGELPERGGGGSTVRFQFPSAMWSHISEFGVGQYKKAHRHLCGANVLILSGEGYSLVWQEGDEEPTRIDWSPYALFDPPTHWFHQHFNTSTDKARYLVFHTPVKGTGLHQGTENDALFPHNRKNQIQYHEEDPQIREEYQQELAEAGIEFQMDPSIYERDTSAFEALQS